MKDSRSEQLELLPLRDCQHARWRENGPSEEPPPLDATVPKVLAASTRLERHPAVRSLKIEAEGDLWKGIIKPKIRLIGRWLERAGFCPGLRVQVRCLAPGVIELRSAVPALATEATPPLSEHPDAPL